MNYETILKQIRERAFLKSNEDAERLLRVVLQALADRVERGAVEPVVERLPAEAGAYFRGEETARPYQLDELFKRVSKETGADMPATVQQCQTVTAVVTEAVGHDAMRRLREQLPVSWNRLFPTGPYHEAPAQRTT